MINKIIPRLQTNVSSLTKDLNELKILCDSHHKQSLQYEISRDQSKKEYEQLKITNDQLTSQVFILFTNKYQ